MLGRSSRRSQDAVTKTRAAKAVAARKKVTVADESDADRPPSPLKYSAPKRIIKPTPIPVRRQPAEPSDDEDNEAASEPVGPPVGAARKSKNKGVAAKKAKGRTAAVLGPVADHSAPVEGAPTQPHTTARSLAAKKKKLAATAPAAQLPDAEVEVDVTEDAPNSSRPARPKPRPRKPASERSVIVSELD